jgi:hypothetical protein
MKASESALGWISDSAIRMNTKYLFIVAAMTAMLIGATALATDSAFADKKKKTEYSQALSQANACGKGKLPLNVFCSNSASQIQGEENAVSLSGSQQAAEEEDDLVS